MLRTDTEPSLRPFSKPLRAAAVAAVAVVLAAFPTACKDKSKSSDDGAKASTSASKGGEAGTDGVTDQAPAKDPAEIIAAHVEAAGGQKAREFVEAIHFSSKLDTGAQKISAASDHWWQKDGKFFEEEDIPGFGVAQLGYDGEEVWSVDPINGARTLSGTERAQALWLADPFHWWHWRDHHASAKYLGQVEDDAGRTVDRVQLDGPAGKAVASFDVESHFVVGLEYTQVAPTGNVPLTFTFEDYEPRGPLQVANRQTAKLPLGEMSQVYEEVEINPSLEDVDFSSPGSEAAIPARPEDASGNVETEGGEDDAGDEDDEGGEQAG